jgi:hypothetical protein
MICQEDTEIWSMDQKMWKHIGSLKKWTSRQSLVKRLNLPMFLLLILREDFKQNKLESQQNTFQKIKIMIDLQKYQQVKTHSLNGFDIKFISHHFANTHFWVESRMLSLYY